MPVLVETGSPCAPDQLDARGRAGVARKGLILMSNAWYARPVLFVKDIDRSVEFYVKQLGFAENWRYEEAEKAWVAQVARAGCELILTAQWPEKAGKALMFISLDHQVLNAVRAELEGRGVEVKDGSWGYPLMVIEDPDGNELYFPYPKESSPRERDGGC